MKRFFVAFDGKSGHIVTEDDKIKSFHLDVTEGLTASSSSTRDMLPGDYLFLLANCNEDEGMWKDFYCSYAAFQSELVEDLIPSNA